MNPGGWQGLIDVMLSLWDDDLCVGRMLHNEEAACEESALNEILEADRLATQGAIPRQDATLITRKKRRAVARVLSTMFTAIHLFDCMNEISRHLNSWINGCCFFNSPIKSRELMEWQKMFDHD
jgi:hypothetical protein